MLRLICREAAHVSTQAVAQTAFAVLGEDAVNGSAQAFAVMLIEVGGSDSGNIGGQP